MNKYMLKSLLRNIPVLGDLYVRSIGSKRKERIESEKRAAVQKSGMSAVREVEKALGSTGVKFFLDFGSLLGIVREQKFMDHDNDLDYGIYINERFTWADLEAELVKHKLKKVRQGMFMDQITEQTYRFDDSNLLIDFFYHWKADGYDNTYVFFMKSGRKYQYPTCSVSRLEMYSFDGVQTVLLQGVKFRIPMEPEKYLASIYSENWRIPDPNWVSEKGPAWNEIPNALGRLELM